MMNWGIFQTALLGRITPVSTGPVVPSLGRLLVAVEDAVKVEPVGEFELKGIRLPLAAYNVVRAVVMRQRFAPPRHGAIVPIRREPSQTRSESKRRSTTKMI